MLRYVRNRDTTVVCPRWGRTLQFEQHLFAYNRSANVFMLTQLMKHVII